MPPRYAYWTIIVDGKPTAFRSGSKEELLPTFNRLKAKDDTAVMMWWQNGKLWPTRVDAQEAMIGRGEMGRRGDVRQSGSGFRDRDKKPFRERSEGGKRSAWTPRGEPSTPAPARNADDKLDWKPKGEFVPAPKRADRAERPERSEWKPKSDWKPKSSSFDRERKPEWKPKGDRSEKPEWKPEWKPKGSFDRERKPSFDREERPRSFKRPDFKPSGDDSRSPKPEWKPKGSFDRERKPSFDRERKPDWKSKGSKPDWKPKGSFDREKKADWKPRADRSAKLEWTPKGDRTESPSHPRTLAPSHRGTEAPAKRKWVPKEEYKKSMGIEAKRDGKWRPGGEHKDPKQKYKDAKKAKWTKFKTNIRTKWESKKKS